MDFNKQFCFYTLFLMFFCLTPNAKAQYNLQLDSVITDVWEGYMSSSTGPPQTKTYTVPTGKVWKVSSAFSKTSVTTVGIDMYLKDPSGDEIRVSHLSYSTGVSGYRSNIKEALGGYYGNETGLIWLSAGSQIVFQTSGNTGAYASFISILQFSTQ